MASKTIAIPGKKIDTYTIEVNGKECKCIIQEPSFETVSAAMSVLMTMNGSIILIGAGKVIFEGCCTEYDQEIEDDTRTLVKLCLQFATDYVTPSDQEIKKN